MGTEQQSEIKHIRQTTFGPEKGNCFSACIAMVTDIPLEEIPTFCADKNPDWWGDTVRWLLPRGWAGVYIPRPAWENEKVCLWAARTSGIPIIMGGESPRFPGTQHAIVLHEGRELDPHPDDTGIGEIKDVILLIPVSAWKEVVS